MRRDRSRAPLAVTTALAVFLLAPAASAFCRTTTSKVPADYDPSVRGCWTQGLPLYWSNACVSYDVQQNASKYIPYGDAASGIATAFAKWTSTTCPTEGTAPGRVSIDVRDFGPVACAEVQYNQYGPNQHVIIFHDDGWPYQDSSNTLALTTVTYDLDTGEIYDADMEVNTSTNPPPTDTANVAPDGYDFLSIVTHETGHFLGMAHATDIHATMYAHYTQGEEVMRLLTEDDINGICTIYPPSGLRSVASVVPTSSNGELAEVACDPTPRHGFTTQCEGSGSGGGGCIVASAGDGDPIPAWPVTGFSVGFLMLSSAFRRARLRRSSVP